MAMRGDCDVALQTLSDVFEAELPPLPLRRLDLPTISSRGDRQRAGSRQWLARWA